jgi:hypothetical protein
MSAVIFVLTSPRSTSDPYEYLKNTIKDIESQSCDTLKILFSDGPYTGPKFDGWLILEHKKVNPSNRDAWFALIEAAASYSRDALCFEDDVTLCPGSLHRMLDLQIPGDCAGIRFFTPKQNSPSKEHGLHRLPAKVNPKANGLFLQCVKFSAPTLVALDLFRLHPNFNLFPQSADQTIGQACTDLHLVLAAHKPDLVEHVGQVSKLNKVTELSWWRKSENYSIALDIQALDPNLYV